MDVKDDNTWLIVYQNLDAVVKAFLISQSYLDHGKDVSMDCCEVLEQSE